MAGRSTDFQFWRNSAVLSIQLKRRRVPVAAVALAGMLVGSAAAYADATSPSPIDEQTAGRIRDGVVKIDDRVTREAKGRSHGSQRGQDHGTGQGKGQIYRP